jgi:hypothetical protein
MGGAVARAARRLWRQERESPHGLTSRRLRRRVQEKVTYPRILMRDWTRSTKPTASGTRNIQVIPR